MILDHPGLTTPADDTVLWRFMDFTKFVSLLASKHLFFSHVREMEDKYEGALTQRIASRDVPFYQEMFSESNGEEGYDQFLGNFREARDTFCISCWHINSHESAAMWKLYLKSDEGVAIRTTFGDMKRAFSNTPDTVFPAVVKYIDYTTDDFPLNYNMNSLVHKRKSFEHEAEFRLLWWYLMHDNLRVMGLPVEIDRPGRYEAPGRTIPVEVPTLVQQLYVAPTSKRWFTELVTSVARQYDLTCPIIKSSLWDDPVW